MITNNTTDHMFGIELFHYYKKMFKMSPVIFVKNKVDNDFIRNFPNKNDSSYEISCKYNYGIKEIINIINSNLRSSYL